jgi:hypothetical protein
MATWLGTGITDAAQRKEQKAVPLKVVVLIDAKTKGVSAGAKIKQIGILKESAVAKKSLGDLKERDGKGVKRLNGTYVVKDAKVMLADGGVVACPVLVAVEPGKTTLRDVNFVSTLRATSGKELGTWYGYTAVFDTPAPEDQAADNAAKAKKDEIKGDEWKIGFGNDSQVRPRPWVVGKDDVVWLLVLKREKP